MEELVKVCPACGAEYLPHIEKCADCAATLVLPGHQPAAPPAPSPGPGQTVAGDLVCIRVADLDWARRLGARLERAGIDHLLEAQETEGARSCHGAGRFQVMVRRDDAGRAAAVDAEQLQADVPEMAGAADAAGDTGGCPACGDPVPERAAECPSCGLVLAFEVPACAACGESLPPGARTCPACGRAAGPQCC
jgi:hypothetical protein